MGIPTSYNDITIKQFIDVSEMTKHPDLAERRAQVIHYFTGKNLIDIPAGVLKVYRDQVDELIRSKISEKIHDKIKVGENTYYGVTDITLLNTGQYTAIKQLCEKGQAVNNINRILGLIFYKVKGEFNDRDYKEISDDMLNAKVGSVYGTVFFYSKVLETLNPILELYLIQSMKVLKEWEKELREEVSGMSSDQYTDGTML